MEEEKIDMSAELEQLRAEYAVLRNKLSGQEIINNRLIMDVVRGKVNVIETHERVEYIMCVVAAVFSPVYHFALGASWLFCGATVLLMAFTGYWTMLRHKNVKASKIADKDMLSFLKNVKSLRYEYVNWLKIALPLIAIWLGWLFYEIFINMEDIRKAIYLSVCVLVGALIGGCIGLCMRNKVIHACDAIIAQLEN